LGLLAVGWGAALGAVYFGGCLLIALLLIYQHRILRPQDLSRMQRAFFEANVVISLTLLGTLLWEFLS